MNSDKKGRYEGCLLGGAIGDALGYPVEFQTERQIAEEYGADGIQTLDEAGNPAEISDDTQMTLFAANSLIYEKSNPDCRVDGSDPLLFAYLAWLETQSLEGKINFDGTYSKMWIYGDKRLHARRAPGNTCMAALRAANGWKNARPAANNSKGCGTVMRAAPFGLAVSFPTDDTGREEKLSKVRNLAEHDAVLTHGHSIAAASSAALAQIVYLAVQDETHRPKRLETLILQVESGDQITDSRMKKAVELALDPAIPDLKGVHQLGEGWVAEEALAIAIFCAVRYQDDFGAAIRASVNHKGDSDSTGAVCGNILGAWLGREAVETAFDLNFLELEDIISQIACDLYRTIETGVPAPGDDPAWDQKYRK